ncbi:hypothetical protein TTRE_0000748801 [Trichuris trichiura]|uniref:Uncharacterized protein n=1 Tax=Trichuris trichiura TaxID=36087 RepID=A0A077ZHW1_TRITR|nr:hypothetical protein TTRE_0000748801 [Trichuris trichiura]
MTQRKRNGPLVNVEPTETLFPFLSTQPDTSSERELAPPMQVYQKLGVVNVSPGFIRLPFFKHATGLSDKFEPAPLRHFISYPPCVVTPSTGKC